MIEKNQILEQLKSVHYPGFNRDIVSFGMVKEIIIDHKTITIMLSISSQNEEKKAKLVQNIKDTLIIDDLEVAIKLLENPSPQNTTVDTSNKHQNVEGNIKKIIAVETNEFWFY